MPIYYYRIYVNMFSTIKKRFYQSFIYLKKINNLRGKEFYNKVYNIIFKLKFFSKCLYLDFYYLYHLFSL